MGRPILERTLKKIWWLNNRSLKGVTISVIDRINSSSGINDIELDEDAIVLKDRIVTNTKIIPLHRVVSIKFKGRIIWSRRNA